MEIVHIEKTALEAMAVAEGLDESGIVLVRAIHGMMLNDQDRVWRCVVREGGNDRFYELTHAVEGGTVGDLRVAVHLERDQEVLISQCRLQTRFDAALLNLAAELVECRAQPFAALAEDIERAMMLIARIPAPAKASSHIVNDGIPGHCPEGSPHRPCRLDLFGDHHVAVELGIPREQ